MADLIKKVGIKNSGGTGYDSRDIGAEAENIEVSYDAEGKITDKENQSIVKSLNEVLSASKDDVDGKAPINHADATDKFGAASATKYGHVKIGKGLTVDEDGYTNVAFAKDGQAIDGQAVEANDFRLSDARKSPSAITFSDGKSTPTTVDYDGAEAKTVNYSTVGAAPKSHASSTTDYGVGSTTNYGHVKAGTGLAADNGTLSVSYGTTAGTAAQGNDSRLSDARTPKSHAATTTTYGAGNASNYGHVKLTDTYAVDNPSAASNGAATSIAASAYALQQAYSTLNSKLNADAEIKDITADFTSGVFSNNLSKYKPGNYIKATYGGRTYIAILAHYNYFYSPRKNDYANIQSNHWTCITFGFDAGQMNSTNTTAGGYKGSAAHAWCIGDATTAIRGAFGSHAIAHSCLLSNGTYNANSITHGFSWEWVDNIYAVLPSEVQLYGSKVWSDLGWSTGEANRQLALFRYISPWEVLSLSLGQSGDTIANNNAWCRDISASSPGASFCSANSGGDATGGYASYSLGRFPIINLK